MNADELRLRLLDLLRDDLDCDVEVQGKRLIVRDGHSAVIILVTAAKVLNIGDTFPDTVAHG